MTVLLCLLAAPALAQQPLRDLSMSPQDSMRDYGQQGAPSYPQQQPNYGTNNYPAPNTNNYGADPIQQRMRAMQNTNSNRFMDGYCDPNFNPPAAANMQGCLQREKQQSCSEFSGLPTDVQRVIDDTVSCNFNNGNEANSQASCTANDTQRLELLKKYWQDQNVSSALVFLPDDVLFASQKCMRGRH